MEEPDEVTVTEDPNQAPVTQDLAETRSLPKGKAPVLRKCTNGIEELEAAVTQIRSWLAAGYRPGEIGIFAPYRSRVAELSNMLIQAGIRCGWLASEADGITRNRVQLGAIHETKGFEFEVVLLIDCVADVLANTAEFNDSDDPDTLARERQLLYVGMTRARKELVMTWSGAPSPFIESALSHSDARK